MNTTAPRVDDLGGVVALPEGVERIVSLVPNLSELLWSWGLADRLVGVTEWCVAPPDGFPAARRIRGTKNPDLQAIVGLAPDLVLANEEENRQRDVEALRAVGIAVHVTRVRSLSGLSDSLQRLGATLGVGPAADRLVADIDAALAACTLPNRPQRVSCAVWRDDPGRGGDEEGWWLVGHDTYAADLLSAVGADPQPDDPHGRYPRCSFGAVRALEPDLLLLPDEPYAFGPADRAEVERVGIPAVLLDGMDLWWWGSRTPTAVRRLARLVG